MYSCKKVNKNLNDNLINKNKLKTTIINPYNQCGIIHNEVLTVTGNMENFPYVSIEDQ